MSDSFLGRWSNRKLQKKAPKKTEHSNSSDAAFENDPSYANTETSINVESGTIASDVFPAIPDVGDASENPITTVGSESTAEPPRPKTGEMDTSSDSDNDKKNEEPEPLLSDADMPDIQTLDATSDISAFFNRGVSKTLRNAALKHIFGLSAYNVRDGLNDYDEDYTVFEPLGDTVTCDMKFHKERKEKLEAERLEQERLEQERLLAEAESESNKELEEQEADDAAVASNGESDEAVLPQDESEFVLADSSNEHSNERASKAVVGSKSDDSVATTLNNDHESIVDFQDESEHV